MAGSAAVEAEDEFIEVGLQVLGPQAVVDAERPGLEVGEDAVDPRQDQVGGHGADDMGFVARGRQSGIARPAIGLGGRAGCDMSLDEGVQTARGKVVDGGQTQAPRASTLDLDRPGQ